MVGDQRPRGRLYNGECPLGKDGRQSRRRAQREGKEKLFVTAVLYSVVLAHKLFSYSPSVGQHVSPFFFLSLRKVLLLGIISFILVSIYKSFSLKELCRGGIAGQTGIDLTFQIV